MKLDLLTTHPSLPAKSRLFSPFSGLVRTDYTSSNLSLTFLNPKPVSLPRFKVCSHSSPKSSDSNAPNSALNQSELPSEWKFDIRSPTAPSHVPPPGLSLADQAFFLLAFIACTTCVAFTALVIAAVPALYAMGKAAISLSKLADTVREELPATMTAIRLSGMEISDLTLELSDLSQEISDGVGKSAKAVQAAQAGIRQISSLARHQTASMIQEISSMPITSIQPVVVGAAKKTSYAVGQATRTLVNLIAGTDLDTTEINEDGSTADRLDIQ